MQLKNKKLFKLFINVSFCIAVWGCSYPSKEIKDFYHTLKPSSASQIEVNMPSGVYGQKLLSLSFIHPYDSILVYVNDKLIRDSVTILKYKIPEFSIIPSTPDIYKSYPNHYKKPRSLGAGISHVKVVAFLKENRVDSVSLAYVLGSTSDIKLPIVSLKIKPKWLFSKEKGLFVPGVHYEETKDNSSGNYFQFKRRKKKAKITILGEKTSFVEQDVKFRLHGLVTPLAPQKSLRIYLNDSTNLPSIFNTNQIIDKIVLRSSYSGWGRSIFIDGIISQICSNLRCGYMKYSPSVVFLNGEFWGIYGLRERVDRYSIANANNLEPDSLVVSDEKGYNKPEGVFTDYKSMLDLMKSDSISYKEVSARISMNSFIDWLAAELFFQNYDWPCNNTFLWKGKSEDSKWKPVLIDLDACVGKPKNNWFQFATKDRGDLYGPVVINYLFNQAEFREEFKSRVDFLLQNDFSTETLLSKLEEFKSIFEPIIESHYSRWGEEVNDYLDEVEKMELFFVERQRYFEQNMNQYLSQF